MKLYLVFTLLLNTISADSISPANCGLRPLVSAFEKIVNGAKAIPGDWGWSVSLTTNDRHFCGGVLITDQWILTAAHCFMQPVSNLAVDIGVHNRNNKEPWTISSKVSKTIVHENFNIEFVSNDIALVKLENPILMDDTYIIAACLPESNDGSLSFETTNHNAWMTGWGNNMVNGASVVEKMEVEVNYLSETDCKEFYGEMINTQSQICAGDFGANQGACQGDSGGPFVVKMEDGRWYVWGLISWTYDCGKGTVLTRVSHYLPWIKDKIENN